MIRRRSTTDDLTDPEKLKNFASLQQEGTDCFRIHEGVHEGVLVDRYGSLGVVTAETPERVQTSEWTDFLNRTLETFSLQQILFRRSIPDRSHAQPGQIEHHTLLGPSPGQGVTIKESGMSYEIRPFEPFSVGFFCDQRENRLFLRSKTLSGTRVLNLFSYTCSFSVVAAHCGGSVVSVDQSKKYLEWGKKNFELNGLSLQGHKFIVEDARVFLARALRRGQVFDFIVLDPPSFSRSRNGKVFSLVKEAQGLFELAVNVLAPGGTILFSCNYQGWLERELDELVAQSNVAFTLERIGSSKIPFDFSKGSSGLKSLAFCKVAG